MTNKSLYILVDPEKEKDKSLWKSKAKKIASNPNIEGILLGGSTLNRDYGPDIIHCFKTHCNKPIIGFPGSAQQIYKGLSGILFLNYLNSDEASFSRVEPILAAKKIENFRLPTLPCAYIIINKKSISTTLKSTRSKAFHPDEDREEIMNRIAFAWHSGQRYLYLEAGSGSASTIELEIIQDIKKQFHFHIIVGGGIRNRAEVEGFYDAGADTVIIGTAVEEGIIDIADL